MEMTSMENVESATAKPRQASHSTGNGTTSSSGAPGAAPASDPQRSNSRSSPDKAGHVHRQSFAENQRHPPAPLPRTQRPVSLTQQAFQDFLSHLPSNRCPNPKFVGREWRDIALGELVDPEDVKWAELDTSVQDATMSLLKNNSGNVVLVREDSKSKLPVTTFDYTDLNAYLLAVVGLAKPDPEHVELYEKTSQSVQTQITITLREIQVLTSKEGIVALPAASTLAKAMEIFGSGVHQVLVTNETSDVAGVLSQMRLVEFFWNEGVNFPDIDQLYGRILLDLQIGTQSAIAINGDAPLADALLLMHNEGLSSVAVVDNGQNVVGNISIADLRLLTTTTSLENFKLSCMHFVGVILSERGVERGRDSFPVFYVTPYSTLAHTVAKLVATQSHRMWVVECASQSPSNPTTPLLPPAQPSPAGTTNTPLSGSDGLSGSHAIVHSTNSTSSTSQSLMAGQSYAAVPASAMPGTHVSGHLSGVVSLTDILNLFARASGLNPSDPSEQRARRRRSSSSSVRPNVDSGRTRFDYRR